MSSVMVPVIADFKELIFVDLFPASNYLKGFNQISSKAFFPVSLIQSLQTVLITQILEPINQFRGSPLNLFQTFNVFLEIGRPGLYAVHEMRSDISLVENQEGRFTNPGEVSFDCSQYIPCFLCCFFTLLCYLQVIRNKNSKILLSPNFCYSLVFLL